MRRYRLEPLDDERRTFLAERNATMIAAQPALAELRAKLLSIGGHEVCFVDLPHFLPEMIARGAFQSARHSLMCYRQRNRCHANACEAWCGSPETVTIQTGYALSGDGVWRYHSWITRYGRVEETTARRTAYFGIALTVAESLRFAADEAADWVWLHFTDQPIFGRLHQQVKAAA